MAKNRQLEALSVAYKVEERKYSEAKQKIDEVIEERQGLVNSLLEQQRVLSEKLSEARTSQRASALLSGDAAQLASISRYVKDMHAQLAAVAKNLEEKSRELMQAIERGDVAAQELIDSKIEQKRLELYKEKQETSKRIIDAAADEISAEELHFYQKK